MKWWWCFNCKFHPKSELWRPVAPVFQGVWGLRLPGKVSYIKIPNISHPEANWAIYEVMVMFWLQISSKIRTLVAGGPVFLGGMGSETSRQGFIHQNTQHKSSGGKSIFFEGQSKPPRLMQCSSHLNHLLTLRDQLLGVGIIALLINLQLGGFRTGSSWW